MYKLLKENASLFDLIIPEKELAFEYDVKKFSFSKPLINYFSKEILKLKDGEVKKYLLTLGPKPFLFIMNKDYLFNSNDGRTFYVFDKELNDIGHYCVDKDEHNKNYVSSLTTNKHTISYRKLPEKENDFFFGIELNTDLSIMKKTDMPVTKNVINLESFGNNQIVSVKFFDDYIEARFKNSFYSKMKLDYNFKILSFDFHSTLKKELNIDSPIEKIDNYKSLINTFESNFDFYRLVNDSNFKVKLKEYDFKKHLAIIKEITNNKESIFNLILSAQKLTSEPSYALPDLSPSFLNSLDLSCQKYFGKSHSDIIQNSRSESAYNNYTQNLIPFIIDMKERSIDPFDKKTVELLDNLSKSSKTLYNNLDILKKNNKKLKSFFESDASMNIKNNKPFNI